MYAHVYIILIYVNASMYVFRYVFEHALHAGVSRSAQNVSRNHRKRTLINCLPITLTKLHLASCPRTIGGCSTDDKRASGSAEHSSDHLKNRLHHPCAHCTASEGSVYSSIRDSDSLCSRGRRCHTLKSPRAIYEYSSKFSTTDCRPTESVEAVTE